jgi:uncharacterized protein YciI
MKWLGVFLLITSFLCASKGGQGDVHAYLGIFIFNTTDLEEARAWVAADPAVQAEILEAELMPWYGSAALVEVPNLHRKVEKVNLAE